MKNTIILIFLFLISIGTARSNTNLTKRPVFRGMVINNSGSLKIKSILTEYVMYDFGNESTMQFHNVDKNGCFEFTLPYLNRPRKLTLRLNGGPDFEAYYYAMPGDDINMKIYLSDKIDSVSFSGVGSAKYNLCTALNLQYNNFRGDLRKLNFSASKDTTILASKLLKFTEIVTYYRKVTSQLLNGTAINCQLKDILNYEFANYYNDWQFKLYTLHKQSSAYQNIIRHHYLENNSNIFNKPNAQSLHSPIYVRSLENKIFMDLLMRKQTYKVELKSVYESIKDTYSGILKDQMIANLLLLNTHSEDYLEDNIDSLILDAIKTVRNSIFKIKLNERLVTHQHKKNKLLESTFTNLSGDIFNLWSLKGKVIFIDVWFLGCTGCATFHKLFEEQVYDSFKNHKDFVFLSINIDKDKTRWLKGVESGKYTSDKYLNVTTGSLALDHPFMKYYGVTGGPFLMIVDRNLNIYDQPNFKIMLNPQNLVKKISEVLDIADSR